MYKLIIIILLGYQIYGLNKLAGYPIESLVKVENALKELPSAVLVECVSIVDDVKFKIKEATGVIGRII